MTLKLGKKSPWQRSEPRIQLAHVEVKMAALSLIQTEYVMKAATMGGATTTHGTVKTGI
jgi:hypothetical protein